MTWKVVEHAPGIETAVDQRGDNGLLVLVNVHERAGHGHGLGPGRALYGMPSSLTLTSSSCRLTIAIVPDSSGLRERI